MKLELRQLRYFVAIVECGSLSSASRILHVAQPALSHHLKNMEAAFGRPLLRRMARGVQPTPEGEVLFRHAAGLLRQVDGLRSAVAGARGPLGGTVSIGLPKTVARLVSLPLFEHVRKRHAQLALEIVDGHSRDLGRALLEGRLDLAVMMPPGPLQGSVDLPFLAEELVVVCPARAPWTPRAESIGAETLSRIPMLLSNRRERLHALLATTTRASRVELDVRGHIDDLGSLLQAVWAGHGATLLPACAVGDPASARGLAVKRLRGRAFVRELLLCRASGAPLGEAVAAVAEAVLAVTKELVDRGRWPAARRLPVEWELFANA